ncbi:hypothetical protein SPRG_01885 [Saprolegnia parasitica CBS 223.65]|uniref:Ion transport domain-containing protein n=1 Tax=Saprolegnia parasitica (strain CBS 223.65) TaxID=695850 RepID=A0A067CUY7_SAPPC|nr:hypothetical protein SPRG_01885 [Saprolegnia parasitica CBS 223.65]KDO33070.1 hypothetical protein SPRG_01885 [Saprolegnia parasitica CBS 223.65]|eukprot:XP_012195841.1 hypothetical protein SPRG_01885 [Saprolegnia parasitica CBS 223.65]
MAGSSIRTSSSSRRTPTRSMRQRQSMSLTHLTERYTMREAHDDDDDDDVVERVTEPGRDEIKKNPTLRTYRGCARWKARIRRFMDEPTSSVRAQIYSYVMILNIMGNFMPWMIETLDGPNHTPGDPGTCIDCGYPWLFTARTYFYWNLVYTVVFSVEFLARWAACKSQRHYWRRARTILDVLALVPSYLLIYNKYTDTPESAYQPYFNMLRMGRNARIAHMLRDVPGIRILAITIKQCKAPLQVTGYFLVTVIMLFATALYYAQPCYDVETCEFTDVFNAAYFMMVTVATVGYGDQTVDVDNVVALLIDCNAMIFGALYLAMPFAIIGVRYQVAWHRHEVRARRRLKHQDSNLTVSIRPIPSVTLNTYAHKATRHYLDLCTEVAFFSHQIDSLLRFVPHDVIHGVDRKEHHELLVQMVAHAKAVMVLFHHNLQDIKAFEPKPPIAVNTKPLGRKSIAPTALLQSVLQLNIVTQKKHELVLGTWRYTLAQWLKHPDDSRAGRYLHQCFFLFALASVLLFYAETTPELQSYGPLSPLCQRAFATYCAQSENPWTDPGCYVHDASGGLRSPLTMLNFYCDTPSAADSCFGYGANYGRNSSGCSTLFRDVKRLCNLRQCQSGHTPVLDMTPHWIYLEWLFGIVFSIELALRYVVAEDKRAYLIAGDTAIDVLSVVPFYAEALQGFVAGHDPIYAVVPTFPTAASILPICKTLRVLKLTRHFRATTVLAQTAILCWRRLLIPLFFLFLSCVATAALFYEIERGTQCFVGLPCMWWGQQLWTKELENGLPHLKRAQIQVSKYTIITDMLRSTYYSIVTFTAVGYGDLKVRTPFGKFLDILVMLFGSCYTAMPLSLVGGQFYACYELYLLEQTGEDTTNGEAGPREDHIPKHLVLSPTEVETLRNCNVLVILLDEMIHNIHRLNDLTPHASFLEVVPIERTGHRSSTQGTRKSMNESIELVRRRASVSQQIARVLPGRRSVTDVYAPTELERTHEYVRVRGHLRDASHLLTTIFFQFTSLVEKIAEATHSESYTEF